jgi:hypothetical protein
MVYVRRVIGSLFIVFGLSFIVQIVTNWDRLDKFGQPVAHIDAAILIAFVGMGLALMWPVRPWPVSVTKRPLRDAPVMVYLRRVFAALCVAGAFAFALRIPRDWHRITKHNHHVGWGDIGLVILFSTWAFVSLWPSPRQNPTTTATSS